MSMRQHGTASNQFTGKRAMRLAASPLLIGSERSPYDLIITERPGCAGPH
jgi:hypothetical protein